jgi:hypothetical protein
MGVSSSSTGGEVSPNSKKDVARRWIWSLGRLFGYIEGERPEFNLRVRNEVVPDSLIGR